MRTSQLFPLLTWLGILYLTSNQPASWAYTQAIFGERALHSLSFLTSRYICFLYLACVSYPASREMTGDA